MATHLGWNIVFVPAFPPAPTSFELSQIDMVAMNISPFTGEQQVQVWPGASPGTAATRMEGSVTMPNMKQPDAENWIQFLRDLQGQGGVFQWGAACQAAFPEIGARFWRLKSNTRKWSVVPGFIYAMRFDIMEAL